MSAGAAKDRWAKVAGGITLAASVFLALGVMVLFHACGPKDDGTWMSCHYAQLAVFGLACGMSVLSLVALLVRGDIAKWLHAAVACLAIVATNVPGNLVDLCMMEGMRCRAIMRPSVILLSAVIVVLAVVSARLERGRGRK